MIRSIRHKGLHAFHAEGRRSGIKQSHAGRLRMLPGALETALEIGDMDIPGFQLHPLKGSQKGRGSIAVNGNWRLTFEFRDHDVCLLDYEDCH